MLPLIDNSIYTTMAAVLGGKTEPLDGLPVSKRNIFSVAVRLNKEKLLELARDADKNLGVESMAKDLGVTADDKAKDAVLELLTRGLGNQIAFHVYDGSPTFDLNLPGLLGLTLATARPGRSSAGFENFIGLALAGVAAMLNTPVCLSVPVNDVAIVDKFLNDSERVLALSARRMQRGQLFGIETDYFAFPVSGAVDSASTAPLIRAFGIRFGPVKLRFFAARIGNALYLTSKPFVLEELAELTRKQAAAVIDPSAQDSTGHAMVRVRAENWNQILPDYRLAWAENHREACLNNLGPIMSIGRAFATQLKTSGSHRPEAEVSHLIHQAADRYLAIQSFCPEGGNYLLSADGRQARYSIHGTAAVPRQPAAPNPNSSLDRLMRDLKRATATLEFTEEGLRAVVSIDRR